jgi:YegS/Rv2252/BmrU family lipid kinase
MAVERALVLINPLSRSGTSDLGPALQQLRARGLELIVETPTRERVAARVAHHCAQIQRIVVAGGDGTLNAAVPALLACGRPVGLLPVGTANDLARTLLIPDDLPAAADVAAQGRLQPIDLGCVNGILYFNAAHIGLGARVTEQMSPAVKRRWGALAYPRTLLSNLLKHPRFQARIDCDNEHLRVRSLQITVGNGRYYGGGVPIAEQARIDDGELFLYSIPPQRLWQLAALLPHLRRGTHGQHPRVLLLHGREITVSTTHPMPISIDGEIRTATPARFSLLRAALQVFVPEEYRHAAAS